MSNLYNKNQIINLLSSKSSIDILKKFNITTFSIFGSLTNDEFNEESDIDIAIIGGYPLSLDEILDLELFFESLLNREIDIFDLRNESLDFLFKINIFNTCKVLYSTDNNKNFDISYNEIERLYNENKDFMHFRRVDVLS